MITDLLLVENGTGGDLVILPGANDFVTTTGYENAVYTALFGGDSTYWGNYIASNPYNSKTEQVLKTMTLNSAGIADLNAALSSDLSFLGNIPGTTYSYQVAITGSRNVSIDIMVNGKLFNMLWNPAALFLNYKVPNNY